MATLGGGILLCTSIGIVVWEASPGLRDSDLNVVWVTHIVLKLRAWLLALGVVSY